MSSLANVAAPLDRLSAATVRLPSASGGSSVS